MLDYVIALMSCRLIEFMYCRRCSAEAVGGGNQGKEDRQTAGSQSIEPAPASRETLPAEHRTDKCAPIGSETSAKH